MGLNISKGNMYGFVTHTFNTVKGKCEHDCTYCYMKLWGGFKSIRFDDKETKTNLGCDNFIFIGSSNDMFANSIQEEWIIKTLNHLKNFDNSYLFQSKNPEGIKKYYKLLPNKSTICTTIETNRFYPEWMGKTPKPEVRADAMNNLKKLVKYVTIEPVLDFDLLELLELIKICDPVQVNIGADSRKHNMSEPSKEKILSLISHLEQYTKVICKSNLKRIIS